MALTQVSRGLLSTSIVDNGNATAITIDGSEDTTFTGRIKNTRGNHQAQLYGTGDNVILRHDSNSSGLLALSRAGSLDVVLDASGNLLVGKTSTGSSVVGQELRANGYNVFTRDGDTPLELYRKTSNGSLLNFTKDGASVGSIGVEGGDSLYIQAGTTSGAGLHMHPTGGTVRPARNGATIDNTIDLGTSTRRFKDLYLSGVAYIENQIVAVGTYTQTTGVAANINIRSDGLMRRSTSSIRYKNTVLDATHGLTELLALRPVTYKGNDDGDTVFGGLIAEEVHDAGLTEFVQYNEDDEPDALAYGNMVSLCIKAIQEQQATITALEARITQLENN